MLVELFPGTCSLQLQSDKELQLCEIRHYHQAHEY